MVDCTIYIEWLNDQELFYSLVLSKTNRVYDTIIAKAGNSRS